MDTDDDPGAAVVGSPGAFEVLPTPGRRLGELGLAGVWAAFLALSVFPPSGDYSLTWFMAPLAALGLSHFLRRAFDSRPRLIVDERGITDRTSIFGGALHLPWGEVRRVSRSRLNGFVQLEIADIDAVRARAGLGRRLQIGLGRVFGTRRIEIRPTLLGMDGEALATMIEERLETFERRELGLEISPHDIADGSSPRLSPE